MGIDSWTGAIVSFSGLPGPSGSGSTSVSPWKSTRPRRSAMRTPSMYSRVRCSCLPKRTPCQPSDTCGPLEPMPSSIRPSESWSRVAAVIAVMAGAPPGVWGIAEPVWGRAGHRRHGRRARGHRGNRRADLDPRRLPGDPAEDRRRVGAVGLRGPHGVVAEPLGLLDDLELVLAGQAEAPVADVDAQLHDALRSLEGCRARGNLPWAWEAPILCHAAA